MHFKNTIHAAPTHKTRAKTADKIIITIRLPLCFSRCFLTLAARGRIDFGLFPLINTPSSLLISPGAAGGDKERPVDTYIKKVKNQEKPSKTCVMNIKKKKHFRKKFNKISLYVMNE